MYIQVIKQMEQDYKTTKKRNMREGGLYICKGPKGGHLWDLPVCNIEKDGRLCVTRMGYNKLLSIRNGCHVQYVLYGIRSATNPPLCIRLMSFL